ncbi:MAG TPA: ATP-binding protein [Solirubrobacteraceae bacterium]|nr:ATP-binding protein [Solirubrobacteraceae bacterium]
MSASFEATFPSTPPGVGAMRREIAAFAQRCGMDADGIEAVRLAVSEAATNAVVHAYRDGAGDLRVRARVGEGELIVVVCDTGVGLAPRPDSPGLGLGMPLIASVTSRFQIVSNEAGTEVHMAFALAGGDSGASA